MVVFVFGDSVEVLEGNCGCAHGGVGSVIEMSGEIDWGSCP